MAKGRTRSRARRAAPATATNAATDAAATAAAAREAAALRVVAPLAPAALLLLKLLEIFPQLTDGPTRASAASFGSMTVVVYGIYQSVVRAGFDPSLLSVFLCICTFTAACDLGIAGHLCGVWGLGSFYPEHGEKYFATSFGVACLGWDGVFHTAIQAYLAYNALLGRSLKPAALVWAGSVVNSMMPLLVGTAATGKFSAGVEFSTALNAPYAIIPIVLCISLFGDKATLAKRRRGATASVGGGGAFVCLLAASHAALVLLHTVQLMAVLGSDAEVAQHWREEVEPVLQQPDKTNVLLIQSVQYFYFLGLYHCFALWEIYHRWRHGTRSVLGNAADWSALGLGAYLQGMWIQLFMASAEYTSPGNIRIVWGGASEHQLTVALAVVGAALAQCWAYHRWD